MNKKLFIFLFVLIILAGVVTKIFYAYNLSGYVDGDPATIGLMARDILDGKFNTFFYGQNYNGALECYWLAPFIYFFGSKPIVLFSGMILLYVLFLITIYKLGSLLKNKYTGLWAMAYCAIAPYPLIHNVVIPYGYHLGLILFGNMALILALYIDKNEKNVWLWILLGLVGGLGFWNHFAIMFYLLPVAVFLCFKKNVFKNIKYYIASFIAFFISSIPFWIHNFQTKFSSFIIRDGKPYKYYPINVPIGELAKKFFGYHVSGLLGIHELDITGIIMWCIVIVSGILFFIRFNRKKLLILLFVFSILGFSYANKFFVVSPKYCYFIPVYTLIAVWIADMADWLNNKIRFLGIPTHQKQKFWWAGIAVLLFVLIFNMNDFAISVSEGKHSERDTQDIKVKTSNYKSIIEFLDANKINGFISDFYTAQAVNFMTDEKITGFDIMDCRPPFDELLQARDRFALLKYHDLFRPSLDVICRKYKEIQVGPYGVAYDFVPYEYYSRNISPFNWKAKSNYNNEGVLYAFDRDIDHFWSTQKNKSPGMYYELDLGKKYQVYKLAIVNITPHLDNFPINYKIETSMDGESWDTVLTGKNPQPLFWSGPRIYWDYFNGRWEIYFEPKDVRFIRIEEEEYGEWHWMINEIFVYEYLGDLDKGLDSYLETAKNIYQLLMDNNVRFVYADFWFSAKVRLWSNGKIGALRVVNECYPERSNTKRQMVLDEGSALVVDRANEEDTDKILQYFNLPQDKEYVDDYVVYQFNNLNNWQEYFLRYQKCLYWLGFTIEKTNLPLYSQILTSYGIKLEKDGSLEDAVSYFKRAVDILPINNIAREHLLKYYLNTGQEDDYNKQLLKLKQLCYPGLKEEVEFYNGITFLGYSIYNLGDKELQIDYFWEIESNDINGIYVFVHFVKDNKTVFQNDHRLLGDYILPYNELQGMVWKESCKVKVPVEVSPGEYVIKLGLWLPHADGKRLAIKNSKHRVAEIGKIRVGQSRDLEKLKGKIIFDSDRTGTRQIYIMDADGSNTKQLTNSAGDNGYSNWSPDGKRIIFSSKRDGNDEIYVMDTDGENQMNLTNHPNEDNSPSWHPDGKRVIFVSDRDGTMNFYLIDTDGGDLVKITDFKDGVNDLPRISPDGKEVIFLSNKSMGWQVFKMDINGENAKRITSVTSGHCEGNWSHDGKKIVYVARFGTGNSDVYVMDYDGKNEKKVTKGDALDYNPRFSPDGNKIVYASNKSGNWEIYIKENNDSDSIRITYTGTNENWPDWK